MAVVMQIVVKCPRCGGELVKVNRHLACQKCCRLWLLHNWKVLLTEQEPASDGGMEERQ